MKIVGRPDVPKEKIVVLGVLGREQLRIALWFWVAVWFKKGGQGKCHLQHLTLRHGEGEWSAWIFLFVIFYDGRCHCGTVWQPCHVPWCVGVWYWRHRTMSNVEVCLCGTSGMRATSGAHPIDRYQDDGAPQFYNGKQ